MSVPQNDGATVLYEHNFDHHFATFSLKNVAEEKRTTFLFLWF